MEWHFQKIKWQRPWQCVEMLDLWVLHGNFWALVNCEMEQAFTGVNEDFQGALASGEAFCSMYFISLVTDLPFVATLSEWKPRWGGKFQVHFHLDLTWYNCPLYGSGVPRLYWTRLWHWSSDFAKFGLSVRKYSSHPKDWQEHEMAEGPGLFLGKST